MGNGKPPSRRSGAGSALVRHGIMPGAGASVALATPEPMVVVFGGLATRGANQEAYMNDVHIWALRGASRWVGLRTIEGRAPMPRCCHCATAIGSKLVIFGGNNQKESFSDLAYLECTPAVSTPDTWSWHWPTITGAGPRARTGATATAIGDRFILYVGGWDPHEGSSRKSSNPPRPTSRGGKRTTPETAGSLLASGEPGPLSSRLAAVAAANIRVGEEDADPFPEAWLLDTCEWTWLRVAADVPGMTGCETPSPELIAALKNASGRTGHTASFLADARALLRRANASGADDPVPVPALLVYGGVKADGEKHGDLTLLVLPTSLVDVAKEATQNLAASRSPAPKRDVSSSMLENDIPAGQEE